jgi:hypothetical protein
MGPRDRLDLGASVAPESVRIPAKGNSGRSRAAPPTTATASHLKSAFQMAFPALAASVPALGGFIDPEAIFAGTIKPAR